MSASGTVSGERRRRGRLAFGLAVAVCAVLAGAPGHAPAQAQPHQEPAEEKLPADMSVSLSPAFSTTAMSLPWGWTTVVVAVSNTSSSPSRGEVIATLQQFGEKRSFEARAPYAVPAGGKVSVRLPVDVEPYAQVAVRVVDETRGRISPADFAFSVADPSAAVLLDVSGSQLKSAIHDQAVATRYEQPSHRGSGSASTLAVVMPRVDAATGDPILPDRTALYNSVDAVLFRSETLARLGGPELEALAGYVLAGGTLAIAMTRPEDQRNPTITALVGGEIAPASMSSEALRPLVLEPPSEPGGSAVPFAGAPAEVLRESLGGFRGGNLHGSAYGNSAAYGLGEVHLLAFDPTRKPALDDNWVRARMIDLARRSYDRRSQVVFRPGDTHNTYQLDKVRKVLDPNESSRWAIAIAAILLLVYAIVAAPANYSIAARRNRPLSALKLLPIFSVITFFLIVGIGVLAKGVTGRSRRLSLVEAGAGMTKGSIRRYRGFFASRAKELTVRTSDASSVVRTAVVSEPGQADDKLVVDREGLRLENVNALPWQTLVMREDGLADVGEGIALVKVEPASVAVKNRSGHALRAAILRLPKGDFRYFAKIEDGQQVAAEDGREIGSLPRDRTWLTGATASRTSGTMPIHPLNAYTIGAIVNDDAPGLADAWVAIEEASQRDASWFLDDVPVLIAQMDGGEGKTSDAGLRLESDRLLVRVVGYGGAL
ncbi:MAG: hypothetical protein R3B70_22440 [Polyangiaceae bacterium]